MTCRYFHQEDYRTQKDHPHLATWLFPSHWLDGKTYDRGLYYVGIMKTIIRIYNSTTSMMESILCGLGSSLWPYLTIIFLNWLVHTKPSDRDECPQNRDICQLLCFCLSPEATTCKTAMNLQVENVKDLKTEHKLLEASPYRL